MLKRVEDPVALLRAVAEVLLKREKYHGVRKVRDKENENEKRPVIVPCLHRMSRRLNRRRDKGMRLV